MRRTLLSLMLLAALSGCILEEPSVTDVSKPTSLVLRFTLFDEPGGADQRGADVGHHCGTAEIRNGRARIASEAYQDIKGSRPFLIVSPDLEGQWSTFGTEGYPLPVPTDVTMTVDAKKEVVARITFVGNATAGHAEVDGRAVELPYSWTKRDTADGWRVEAILEKGPSLVETYNAGPCA